MCTYSKLLFISFKCFHDHEGALHDAFQTSIVSVEAIHAAANVNYQSQSLWFQLWAAELSAIKQWVTFNCATIFLENFLHLHLRASSSVHHVSFLVVKMLRKSILLSKWW